MRRRGPTPCPADATLLALPGDLDAHDLRLLETHVAACASCRETRRALASLDAVLQQPEEAPAGLETRLLARAEALPLRRVPGPVGVAAALASLAAALLLLLSASGRDRPRGPERSGDPGPRLAVEEPETSDPAAVAPPTPAPRESLPVLLAALGREDRRREAILALGALEDERAVPALVPWLGEPTLSEDAREALVGIGGPSAARALASRAAHVDPAEAPAWVRASARADGAAGTRALLGLAAREPLGPLVRETLRLEETRVLPHLLDLARGPDERLAERALTELEALAPPSATPALSALLGVRDRRARAAQVLARIDTPAAAEALWGAVRHPEVRAAFRRGGLGTEAWLLGRLGRGPVRDRLLAIDLLGLCGGPASVPALGAEALEAATAPQAIAALGRIGGEPASRALARIAERPTFRRAAVEALGYTGDPGAVETLLRLGASEAGLRDVAIQALARLPSPEAVGAIVRLERGERPRGSTLRALRGIPQETLCTALVALLEGPLAADARRTLTALGTCTIPSRSPALHY